MHHGKETDEEEEKPKTSWRGRINSQSRSDKYMEQAAKYAKKAELAHSKTTNNTLNSTEMAVANVTSGSWITPHPELDDE